jgi:hypothetical protein
MVYSELHSILKPYSKDQICTSLQIVVKLSVKTILFCMFFKVTGKLRINT